MFMPPKKSTVLETGSKLTRSAMSTVDTVITRTTSEFDAYIAPVRTSVLARFPILFSLLVTFGVAVTFLGFEKLVSQVAFLDENPLLMLILGIGILALTGTLYKKLS